MDHPPWEDLVVFVSLSDDWNSAEAGYLNREAVREYALRAGQELLARGGVRIA